MACGHSFCELCLTEYFLIAHTCPVCKADVREKKLSTHLSLDAEIEEWVERKLDEEEREMFKKKKEILKSYKEQKK